MVLHKIQFLFVSGILQNKLNCCKIFIFSFFLLTLLTDWLFWPTNSLLGIHTHPDQTKPYKTDGGWPNFTIMTKFHNFGQISQLTHFLQNFDKSSQLIPNLTILTKLYNFYHFFFNWECPFDQLKPLYATPTNNHPN